MPAGGDDKTLVLLVFDGTKVNLPTTEAGEQKDSNGSVMTEGPPNALTHEEIADLLALFEARPGK